MFRGWMRLAQECCGSFVGNFCDGLNILNDACRCVAVGLLTSSNRLFQIVCTFQAKLKSRAISRKTLRNSTY